MKSDKLVNYRNEKYPCLVLLNNDHRNADIYVKEIGYSITPPAYREVLIRDVFIIHYILEGKGVFLDTPVEAGNGFLVVPAEPLIFESDKNEPYIHCWIMFDGAEAKRIVHECGFKHHNHVFDTPAPCIPKMIKDAVFAHYGEEDLDLSLLSLFYKLMSVHKKSNCPNLLQNTDPRNIEYVNKAALYIHENFNRNIKINDVAKFVNISQNYLCKLFNDVMGRTPKVHIMQLRMDFAEYLLLNTNMNIGEISKTVGYDDSMYFSQVFRKYSHKTPTEYRQINNIRADIVDEKPKLSKT